MTNTTRFDRSDDNSAQNTGDTHRLSSGARPPLICLRCQGVMVPTSAWGFLPANPALTSIVGLTLLDAHPNLQTTGVGCSSMTCVNCGYTELYGDTSALKQRLQEVERSAYKAQQRNRQRSRQ